MEVVWSMQSHIATRGNERTMTFVLEPSFHIAFVLGLLVATVASFAIEKLSLEATAVGLLVVLLVWFQVFPITGDDGTALLGPRELLV